MLSPKLMSSTSSVGQIFLSEKIGTGFKIHSQVGEIELPLNCLERRRKKKKTRILMKCKYSQVIYRRMYSLLLLYDFEVFNDIKN